MESRLGALSPRLIPKEPQGNTALQAEPIATNQVYKSLGILYNLGGLSG